MIRHQYYFRENDLGVMAWDIRRLVELTRDLPVKQVCLTDIAEFSESYWYSSDGEEPTCRSLLQHMRLIDEADLRYPIILDRDGQLMDGMHRVCKAVRTNMTTIQAVRFVTTPKPDYVGNDPDELPYED